VAEWKKPLLIGIGWGVGTAIGLALLVAGFLWYQGRPKPPRPWNTVAIVSKNPPSFASSKDFGNVEFTYAVENATSLDYEITSDEAIKVIARYTDGTLSAPLPKEVRHLDLPVFIPSKEKGVLTLSVALSEIPKRRASETDEQYHERLRAYCEEQIGGVANFVLFDEANRYQINLPRWLAEPPKKNEPAHIP
jgi:hypothetical protein